MKRAPKPPKDVYCYGCSGRAVLMYDYGQRHHDRPNRLFKYRCESCKWTCRMRYEFATGSIYDNVGWQFCYDGQRLRWNAGREEYWACRIDCMPAPEGVRL